MVVREVRAKGILSKSQVYDYALNPYVGCQHACAYCYARFMRRFTGHAEAWGGFVDAKVNAPELLAAELGRKRAGRVWVSGVCDAYQPVEERYGLTGRCIELLAARGWPVKVQTKSALVLRDIAILKRLKDSEVGFTITTCDEALAGLFEPGAPPAAKRIEALGILHAEGIPTYAMIAPILPGAEALPKALAGKVDRVLVDRLNYDYAARVYREHGLQWAMGDAFFRPKAEELRLAFAAQGVSCRIV